jgi:hypothetical protein
MTRREHWLASWLAASPGRRAAFLACTAASLFLLVNWRNYHVDVLPLCLEPVSILRYGTLDLAVGFRETYDQLPDSQKFTFTRTEDGRLYPMKWLFVSLLVVPAYLPLVLAGLPTDNVALWIAWGRVCAAWMTGGSVALIYLGLRRCTREPDALVLTVLAAWGTCLWTIVGQGLYDHTGCVPCLAAIAWMLQDRPFAPGRAFAVSFLAGLAVAMRPTSVILLAPLGVYLFAFGDLPGWRSRLAGLAGVVVMPLALLACNRALFGSGWASGYRPVEVASFHEPWWLGAIGQLVSPNSGLFVQSPFLMLGLVGTWKAWTMPGHGLSRALSLSLVGYWLFYSRWHEWMGGLVFASRFLCDGYPLGLLLVAEGWNEFRQRAWAWGALLLAGLWSIAYQTVGVATFDVVSLHAPPHDPWMPTRHFYALFVAERGLAATLRALARTTCQLALALVLGVGIWGRLLLPLKIERETQSCHNFR